MHIYAISQEVGITIISILYKRKPKLAELYNSPKETQLVMSSCNQNPGSLTPLATLRYNGLQRPKGGLYRFYVQF